jgi:hypothetical protein
MSAALTQDRPVESFHAVSLSGGIHGVMHKGKTPALKLYGPAEELAKIETFVKDGKLVIQPKSVFTRSDEQVTAEITTAALDSIEASGGVSVSGDGLTGARCGLNLSGGVELELGGMACDALEVDASGGARVKLAGQAKKLDLDASGGVRVETRALSVSDARVKASGGVSGGLAVADSLDAELSGGVSLKVKGHPKLSHQETSGSAKLSFE